MKATAGIFRVPLATLTLLVVTSLGMAQAPPGFPGRRPPAPEVIPPPVVAPIPAIKPLTGPGKVYDSAGALWPGKGPDHFNYAVDEYLISGTAAGEPYETRLVIRKPKDNRKFSGLVVAEPMHPAAAMAHAFEYNSLYIMDAGHIAVEIDTTGVEQIAAFNAERYGSLKVTQKQVSEILAQAGALIKSPQSPIADLKLRKMVLWGTSASSQMVVNYLSTHKVFKLAGMANIYDGFLPTMNNGSNLTTVDVPIILVPTQVEYQDVATAAQDSDEPGKQLRVYEFAAMAHLDSRNTRKRLQQEDCLKPLSELPLDPLASVALYHLLRWVDKGISPPHAPRVIMDMYTVNDGSLMQLDQYGNAMGGIRNTWVDVPLFKYTMHNPPNPASTGAGSGRMQTPLLCFLSGWQTPIDSAIVKKKYGTPANYVRQVEKRLNELEAQGWSLPIYHEVIMTDARAVKF
ncbi:MAG TPA: alpha/beta hydrolase domain-containing protein [Steroidobacteraceae bacterium]|nr:alpha/beta hydrolase domain-containing protein [Steroidobacteraceae bacterium]